MATTAFEDTGATTTYDQELAYVEEILADHPSRLTKIPVATTTQGREVYALRVGSSSATGAPLLIESTIHGNEREPREASLIAARELAATTDPQVVGLLDTHPLYIVPCSNPDGQVAFNRNDSTGVNLNRALLNLIRPEVRGLTKLARDIRPLAALSGHQTVAFQFENCPLKGPSPHIHNTGRALIDSLLIPEMERQGWAPEWYLGATMDTSLWRTFGLRNILMTLVELDGYATAASRVEAFLAVIDVWLGYVIDHRDDLLAQMTTGEASVSNRLALGHDDWWVSAQWVTPNVPELGSPPVTAAGYVVTAAQWASAVTDSAPAITVEELFEVHGITTYTYGADRWVPLGQPLAPLIVRLIDPSAANEVIQATRTATTPAQFAQPGDVWQ